MKFLIWLVSHREIQPCFFIKDTLPVGKCLKSSLAMVSTHTALAQSTKCHLRGCNVNHHIIDTSATVSYASCDVSSLHRIAGALAYG